MVLRRAFLEGAEALFVDVAREAIDRADLNTGDIDTVVTVCSTGIAAPTLEARASAFLDRWPAAASKVETWRELPGGKSSSR